MLSSQIASFASSFLRHFGIAERRSVDLIVYDAYILSGFG